MKDIDLIIEEALKEDIPSGDISSMYLFSDQESTGEFIAKESGIISGIKVCKRTFEIMDGSLNFKILKHDGDAVSKGEVIATVKGKTLSILAAERVGLNFLQRMSGIATMTHQYVLETEGTKAEILDTRKTTPLLRMLEKQAVRDGLGRNHRMSLSDMVMLKDNHLKASISIQDAVEKVRRNIEKNIEIEVEVESEAMFLEALETDCDIIMLDNMDLDTMQRCVELNQGKKKLEASGNMTFDRIKSVARTGVDYISVGALTHSYKSLDISLKF